MKKLNEEEIVKEIMKKCSKKERVLINKNEDFFIKIYNIGRLNTINKLLD